jgi:AraC-like DNA-binding protein
MRFKEFFKRTLSEAFDSQVLQMQKELKDKGEDLGSFGPNQDGLDGRLGPYTRRAASHQPDIANKYKDVLSRPDSIDAQKIDVTTIQDPDFQKKLEKVATELGVKSSDLMAIFKQESSVNPQAVNRTSGATGLIQFMPDTARRLGTTTDDLVKMNGVQQLDYVYKYFKMTGVGDGTLGDLYMAVFMPKYVGFPNHTVLGASGAPGFSGKVYAQNRGLDRNGDGTITVADVKSSVERFA